MLARSIAAIVALVIAAGVWLPLVHLFFGQPVSTFRSAPDGLSPKARALATRHVRVWSDGRTGDPQIALMRATNPEWDLMGRTYTVLALANMALREPATTTARLTHIDQIIDRTLADERDNGFTYFLMDYVYRRPFVARPARSLFVDAQIALQLGARRLLADRPDYARAHRERVELMVACMQASPALVAESYPDECWLFDQAGALAATRMADRLDGSDHTAFFAAWLASARTRLIDAPTGLLISSCTRDGVRGDGPEGSTIWMVAHWLQLIDPVFAADQYARARRLLGRELLGFGYAVEWTDVRSGATDVDSGPIVPFLNVSAGASGLALVGASAFDDARYLQTLNTTLDFAAFPLRQGRELQYCAGNQVGDAVLLYAAVLGPLWERIGPSGRPAPASGSAGGAR